MFFKMGTLLLILIMTVDVAVSAPIQSNLQNQNSKPIRVFVTPGAYPSKIDGTRIFTEDYDMAFPIPDLKDLQSFTPITTREKCSIDKVSCELYSDVFQMDVQSLELLKVLQKMFTTKGLGFATTDFSTGHVTSGELEDSNLSESIHRAGKEWQVAIVQKESVVQDNKKIANKRSKRFSFAPVVHGVSKYLVPAISAATSLNDLFVPNDAIMHFLSMFKSSAPRSVKIFAELPKVESEFVEIEKKTDQFVNSANLDFEMVKKNSNCFMNALKTNRDNTIIANLLGSRQLEKQQSSLTHSLILFVAHMAALQDCRNGIIPLMYIPPSMLKNKLMDIASSLDSELELVVGPSEVDVLYVTKNAAFCQFDNNGGIISVKTYLKPANAKFEFFEFQAMAFAWNQYTCDIGVPSGYIIREKVSGDIYPVSQLSENECHPRSSSLCRLPQASNTESPNHFCMMALLQESTPSQIKAACPLTCSKVARIATTQIDEDTIVVAQLPKQGAFIKCDNLEKIDINHNVSIGSLRFKLGCGCMLLFNGNIVGKSHKKICDDVVVPFTMEHLIPVQLSVVEEWVTQLDSTIVEQLYLESEAVIDELWKPKEMIEPEYFTSQVPIFSVVAFIIQVIFMILIKMKCQSAVALCCLAAAPQANAARSGIPTCVIGTDIYVILIILLIFSALIVIPSWMSFFLIKCKDVYNRAVNNAARKLVFAGTGLEAMDKKDCSCNCENP